MLYDIIVIGKGLIGSATARHLSMTQQSIAIIGPDEPEDINQAVVFSSHYDSGRVQRLVGQTDAMTKLNVASVNQYPVLAHLSGIPFHTGIGCLYVNPVGTDDYLMQAKRRAHQFGIETKFFASSDELQQSFPEFVFPIEAMGMFEPAPAGHISPPNLITAQLHVFKKNGGTIFNDTVNGVTVNNRRIEITTYQGNIFQAKKVVIAAGAFSNFSNLLPRKLDLVLKSETVLLARLSKGEAERLSTLPSLLYEIDTDDVEGIYLTQPIRYPDGHNYLKMGCNLPDDIFFGDDLTTIQKWFRSGDSAAQIKNMREALQLIMPGMKVDDCITKRCILPRTQKHKNPYIGQIDEQLFVTAGNGWSAMCSDGVGMVMTSLVVHGKFPDGFEAAEYEPVFL
jgi:glycine/D-amino acid oxidase-like deaminating enzyme